MDESEIDTRVALQVNYVLLFLWRPANCINDTQWIVPYKSIVLSNKTE